MTTGVMRHERDAGEESSVNESRFARASARWMRLLLRLYPADFREEMGDALVETYVARCRDALRRGGTLALAGMWLSALADSARNGVAEHVRPAVGWRRGGNWGRDAERTLRRLVRAPAFTLSMLATLAVGLGAFATVYAVVHKVLLAPLPYERADDLYFVFRDLSAIVDLKRGYIAGTDVVALAGSEGPIEDAAAIALDTRTISPRPGTTGDATPEEMSVMVTSANLFTMLGARPLLGRVFREGEEGPGRTPTIVLGHELWQQRFGGDRAIVGREVMLDGAPHEVIGVMKPGFRFLRASGVGAPAGADAYITHTVDLARTEPGNGTYVGMVRGRAGSSPEAVGAAVAAVGRAVDERDFEGRGVRLYAVGMEGDLEAPVRAPIVMLGAAGALLVLVLGVNMATLLLVRASQREREFAISRAVGADRGALLRASLLEAGILGAAGGALGALAAVWGTRALARLAPPDLPRLETIAVDWPVAAVVILVGLLLGLVAGAVPAVWATRADLSSLLRNASTRGGGAHGPLRRAMVVAQVALSLVLLTAGGLVVRSFDRLLRAQPGFDAAGVLTLGIPVPAASYPDDARVRALHERLQRELSAIPGVEAVGATTALPLTGGANATTVSFPGAPGNRGSTEQDAPLVDYIMVRPGYFGTLGIRFLSGRDLGTTSGTREAVIDRSLADRFFPNGGAVGSIVRFRADSLTVVGVVEHARQYDVHRDGREQLYVSNDAYTFPTLSFALKSGRSAASLVADVRTTVRRIDPTLALADVQTMEEITSASLRQPRLSAVLLSGFSLGALLLAAMGLYGVVSGSVNHRRHELAVRLALGAEHSRVLRLVLGEGARLVLLGLLVGVPGIWLASRVLGGVLVEVSPFDPATLALVGAGLAIVAAIACYLPARRVAGIEPARSLREG